jgi:hypothetical protein
VVGHYTIEFHIEGNRGRALYGASVGGNRRISGRGSKEAGGELAGGGEETDEE